MSEQGEGKRYVRVLEYEFRGEGGAFELQIAEGDTDGRLLVRFGPFQVGFVLNAQRIGEMRRFFNNEGESLVVKQKQDAGDKEFSLTQHNWPRGGEDVH